MEGPFHRQAATGLGRLMEDNAVRDPVERMRRFVEEQQQEARLEYARALWTQRIPELLPTLEAVAEALNGGLNAEQFQTTPVAVLSDPARNTFPLVVAFSPRQGQDETAASIVFRCEEDGSVHGYRYPFHPVMESVTPEHCLDLGDPASISADELGNAAADFLEWASVGDGCRGGRLSFAPSPATLQLSLVAA